MAGNSLAKVGHNHTHNPPKTQHTQQRQSRTLREGAWGKRTCGWKDCHRCDPGQNVEERRRLVNIFAKMLNDEVAHQEF